MKRPQDDACYEKARAHFGLSASEVVHEVKLRPALVIYDGGFLSLTKVVELAMVVLWQNRKKPTKRAL